MKTLGLASRRARSSLLCHGLARHRQGGIAPAVVTQQLLSDLELYAQWAGAAYCNSDAETGAKVTCSGGVCPLVEANNATVRGTLSDDTLTNEGGFLAVDATAQQIVLSLRGSSSLRNWITNFYFALEDCAAGDADGEAGFFPAGCKAHAGFAAAWAEVRPGALALVAAAAAAHPSYPLVVTGHSLGGAVATLAAAHLRAAGAAPAPYTYGSPRLAGAELRATHADDPVPRLPPLVAGYRHASPEYWINAAQGEVAAYGPGDVVVCPGAANVACNAGTTAFDTDAHSVYFGTVTGCGGDGDGLPFRRRGEEEDDLAERVSRLAALDIEYAKGLDGASPA